MTRWYREKKREHYYKQAKKDGYRARSAYKLKQINKKYNLIKNGDIVVDLGAAPGGWSQITKKIIGPNGKIVGVDILKIKPIEKITFIKGDMTKSETIDEIIENLNGKYADVIISDMSPDISGNYDVDHARSIFLCQMALETSKKILKENGNFLCKVFDGRDLEDFIKDLKDNFSFVKRFSPQASRKSSSELYLIAKDFYKN